MDRTAAGLIVIVALVAVLALLWFAWRRRTFRDAGIEPGYPLPEAEAAPLASADVFYVATTRRDQPLERLNIRGLGFRARGHVAVRDDGLVLSLAGEEPRFIPAAAIETVARATWTIDRVVESDGLLLVGWQAPTADAAGIGVDSYLRIVDSGDRDRVIEALTRIAPVTPAGTTESEA
ncbi:PH-like domain-containing protein [Cryobacterium tepidiphilum]|uniref:PH domain-containing protein n=1 Tax=Cryobacterium tepidiphilum TaxID=2486026 RepID=A0A3M8LM44_9MICO|nr:hypothetical protein [Cryobacterium tepidiphilum]RNE66550.1 hypothetical protein EEJ31_03895 [Cryobacterium tepidiphilum]